MRFEESIDIDAQQQRVWDVLSDIEAWPRRIETVEVAELLTPAPVAKGSRVRLKQPKLPEGTWDITVWDAPSYFELRQKSGGITSVAGHRVEALEGGRSRLTLSVDMQGCLSRSSACSQGHDHPVHDQRGSGHEARRRVRRDVTVRRTQSRPRHLQLGSQGPCSSTAQFQPRTSRPMVSFRTSLRRWHFRPRRERRRYMPNGDRPDPPPGHTSRS